MYAFNVKFTVYNMGKKQNLCTLGAWLLLKLKVAQMLIIKKEFVIGCA